MSQPAPQPSSPVVPHSAESEEAVLASVLLDQDALDLVMDVLGEEDFYVEVHRRIFNAMKTLAADNQPIDVTTLFAKLGPTRALDGVGGLHYLLQLPNRIPSATNVKHYARTVREKAMLRAVLAIAAEAQAQALGPVENVSDFVDALNQRIFSLSRQDGTQPYYAMREVIKTTFTLVESLYERKEKITGVPSGYLDLDEMTAGFQGGDLIILAARPSMGKTALALNMMTNATLDAGVPAAFFSLEMGREQLALRMLCSRARIDATRIRGGFLVENEWERLIKSVGIFAESPIYIDDTPALPVMKMQAKARRLKAEKNIGLIVVDYLQLMKGDERLQSREQIISDISRNLKATAKELNIPIIALSQLNRGVDSRTDKRPMLSDLRESGAIEQDADVIMFIYRDEVYNKETPAKGIAEVIIAKQRNGAIGTSKLKWFGQYTLFENLARDADGASPF